MKDYQITYRGAKAMLSELQPRNEQLQQQQGTQLVSYRGVKGQANLNERHEAENHEVSFRGATGQAKF